MLFANFLLFLRTSILLRLFLSFSIAFGFSFFLFGKFPSSCLFLVGLRFFLGIFLFSLRRAFPLLRLFFFRRSLYVFLSFIFFNDFDLFRLLLTRALGALLFFIRRRCLRLRLLFWRISLGLRHLGSFLFDHIFLLVILLVAELKLL